MRVENRDLGGLEIVCKGPVGAQVLLQFGERKAGIDGQEGARGVKRFQHHFAAAAAAHSISEHAQQLAGLRGIASVHLDGSARIGQFFQLPSLREITNHQLQVLGLLQHIVTAGGLIAVGDHIARQGGQHVVGAGFGRQRGHAREGTQRARDGDGLRLYAGNRGKPAED